LTSIDFRRKDFGSKPGFGEAFWSLARSAAAMWAKPMSEAATPPARERSGQKKWPLRGAAKFREETPRKGGGFAIEDRDTALQQYAETPPGVQAQK